MLDLPRLCGLLLLAQLGVGEGSGAGDEEVGQLAEKGFEARLLGCPVDLNSNPDED